jgi:hypothetical protein
MALMYIVSIADISDPPIVCRLVTSAYRSPCCFVIVFSVMYQSILHKDLSNGKQCRELLVQKMQDGGVLDVYARSQEEANRGT